MPLDLRDLLAALLRFRGAVLDFGIPFVVAQMVVTLVVTVPGLAKSLPAPLCGWLAPPYSRDLLGLAATQSGPFRVATSIAGLPSLLVAVALGPLYAIAKIAGALAAGGLLMLRSGWREPVSQTAGPTAKADRATVPGLGDALLTLLSYLAVPFFVAAVLGGIVVILVPREILLTIAGPGRPWGPAIVAWLAFPFRAVTGTELPLASALLVAGIGPGAAAALVIAAPVLHYDTLHRRLREPGGVTTATVVWACATAIGIAVDLLALA